MAFDVPAGVVAGDIIWLPVYIGDDTATITAMAPGFTHAPQSPMLISGAGSQQHAVLYKRATSSDGDGLGDDDGDTYSFTVSTSVFYEGAAHAYKDAITTGDPWDDVDSATTPGVSGTVSPPVSVTTSVDDCALLGAASNWGGGSWVWTAPFTERTDNNVAVNTTADATQATAGASGTMVATCSSNDKRTAWLGALLPIPTGPNEGAAAFSLALAVAAVGARRSAGAVALGLVLAVAGTGKRSPKGVAAFGLALSVATTGRRASRGVASLGLALRLDGRGPINGARPSKITARAMRPGTLARGTSEGIKARGGYADA